MFDCIQYLIFSVILKILPSRAAVWILSDVHTTTYVSVPHEMKSFKCHRSCKHWRAAEYDRIGPCVRGMTRYRHVSAYLPAMYTRTVIHYIRNTISYPENWGLRQNPPLQVSLKAKTVACQWRIQPAFDQRARTPASRPHTRA